MNLSAFLKHDIKHDITLMEDGRQEAALGGCVYDFSRGGLWTDPETVSEECLFLRKMEMFWRLLLIKENREITFLNSCLTVRHFCRPVRDKSHISGVAYLTLNNILDWLSSLYLFNTTNPEKYLITLHTVWTKLSAAIFFFFFKLVSKFFDTLSVFVKVVHGYLQGSNVWSLWN